MSDWFGLLSAVTLNDDNMFGAWRNIKGKKKTSSVLNGPEQMISNLGVDEQIVLYVYYYLV